MARVLGVFRLGAVGELPVVLELEAVDLRRGEGCLVFISGLEVEPLVLHQTVSIFLERMQLFALGSFSI